MSKKNTDEFYMQRCFDLAKLAANQTQTNPMVGAVLVYNDSIIGEGYHEAYGENHAEINAINSVKEKDKSLIPESTLYISLEPCFHEGKTPPCVERILSEKIKHVFISCLDPFEKVAGKSVAKLQDSGVKVHLGLLENHGKQLIRKFVANTIEKRSYILIKFAQSRDGFMGKENEAVWLTDIYSKTLSHKWRSELDGIMVGTQTAITDNPELTNRLYAGRSPQRIVLDRNERIPKTHKLISDDLPCLVFTSKKDYQIKKTKTLVYLTDWSLEKILKELYNRNVYSILVEGGKQLIQSFIDQNLWDEYRVLKAPIVLGTGIKAPLLQAQISQEYRLGEDSITYGYRKLT